MRDLCQRFHQQLAYRPFNPESNTQGKPMHNRELTEPFEAVEPTSDAPDADQADVDGLDGPDEPGPAALDHWTSFARSETCELRVFRVHHEGSVFLAIQEFRRFPDSDEWFPLPGRGVQFNPAECRELAKLARHVADEPTRIPLPTEA